jgi:hypothetical protein
MSDEKKTLSEVKASGGIKLGEMRYVLGISLALAVIAGVVLWSGFFAG